MIIRMENLVYLSTYRHRKEKTMTDKSKNKRQKVWKQRTTEEYKKKLALTLAKAYKKKQGKN